MTALGLLVAVPAVLAYNYLQSRNKNIAERLAGFATDVLANINSKGAVKPSLPSIAPVKPVAAKPAPAPAKP
jgi:biopolymer transport protein ExbB